MNKNSEFYNERARTALTNMELSDVEKVAAIGEIIDELCPESEEEEPEKSFHSPGMWEPTAAELANGVKVYLLHGETCESVTRNDHIQNLRARGCCCKTKAEAEFVRESQEAKLAIIDRLKILNGGWRMVGISKNYEPWLLSSVNKIGGINENCGTQNMPDCLQAKAKEIWLQVIEEFGAEKVRKALWPVYVEEG